MGGPLADATGMEIATLGSETAFREACPIETVLLAIARGKDVDATIATREVCRRLSCDCLTAGAVGW